MSQTISFSNMKLRCGFPYLHIEAVTYFQTINQHATMTIDLSLEEAAARKLMNTSIENEVICLENSENKASLFVGMIDTIRIFQTNQVWRASLKVISGTKQLDIKRKERSFQNISWSYQRLYGSVLKSYANSQMINVDSLSRTTGQMILQYDETDWELLKRLAARNKTFLVPDVEEGRPRFWTGLKDGKPLSLPETQFTMGKGYRSFQENNQNFEAIGLKDFQELTFSTMNEAFLGDYVNYKGINYIVMEKKAQLQRGILQFSYRAVPMASLKNRWLERIEGVGLTLEGQVLAVQGHMVKVHLSIDKEQRKNEAVWLPYVTEGSNISYYMPEIGSRVKIYFPTTDESQAMATQGIRVNPDSYSDEMGDPSTKILSNVQGKNISLATNNLSIISKEGLAITMTDSSNIAISSPSSINMHASGNVSLAGGQSISVTGDSGVTLQGKSISSIAIASDIQLASPDLQYTGGSGVKAVHKSLEGNGKNRRKKRKVATQSIQDVDAVAITQQALSVIPPLLSSQGAPEKKFQSRATLIATSVFQSVSATKTMKSRSKEKDTNKQVAIKNTGNFRGNLRKQTLNPSKKRAKSWERGTLHKLPLPIQVTPNGNRMQMTRETRQTENKSKIDRMSDCSSVIKPFNSSSTTANLQSNLPKGTSNRSELTQGAKSFDNRLVKNNKEVAVNQVSANSFSLQTENSQPVGHSSASDRSIFGNSLLKKKLATADQRPKISSKKVASSKTDKNQLAKAVQTSAASWQKVDTKIKSNQSATMNAIRPAKNGSLAKSGAGGSGGASAGGGFGVVNKGASSSISPVAQITAKAGQFVKQSNQQKSKKYVENITTKGLLTRQASFNRLSTTAIGTNKANSSTNTIVQPGNMQPFNRMATSMNGAALGNKTDYKTTTSSTTGIFAAVGSTNTDQLSVSSNFSHNRMVRPLDLSNTEVIEVDWKLPIFNNQASMNLHEETPYEKVSKEYAHFK
ncbi:hypothetical protein [Candidatus Enterococcus clewellii]|uniref:Gp5/Type VI secretion system Vgr protein OB-fold domain-containing protein n=1 Tax=Candidatus Enterococcus clewellii TaxID=1834193 RepID=A0A242KCY8_9ENTE|nr:hypothetical protein [Enterococcus sp. 9E7_DIV0242]OTP19033.1 hypothetical protein A5888_000847 [Enterococcus sp. 9E7_DIV0242]